MITFPKTWEERTELYCAYLIIYKKLQSQTIKSYISGIKSFLIKDGYKWNNDLVLLSAITKSCKLNYDITKTRLPIQQKFLELILFDIGRKFGEKQPYLEALYTTAYLFGYYGLMRIGELTESQHVIKAKDVHKCDIKKKLMIFLYTSKTHNQSNRPQKIRIEASSTVTITYNSKTKIIKELNAGFFCPYKWALSYITLRRLRRNDNEQFFIFRDGSNLKAHHLRKTLRHAIENLTLDSTLYDIHSLRIGRATDMQKQGYSIEHIKDSGRWKSNAVYKYLRNW